MKRLGAIALAAALVFFPTSAHSRPAVRIVSLIPSLTEDLFALGAGSRVVGVSEFSDFPPAAKQLPRVASFTSVDAERIVTLHPDLIVGIPAQASLIAPLLRAKLRVELLPDDTLDDIYATLRRLGALVGRVPEADALVSRMRSETVRLERTASSSSHPSVFVVLDVAPIYTVGKRSYINSLIETAGGRNAAGLNVAYGRYSAEALLARQPDVIVVDPAVGFRAVQDREPWRSLHAVQAGNVAEIPDPGILLHPSPRYNEGLAWLIQVLGRVKTQH